MTFGKVYRSLMAEVKKSDDVTFSCRGLKMVKEVINAGIEVEMSPKGIAVFSHPHHRVTPIRFALAELCYILAGRSDLESIASYNKAMSHYSDDGKTISGSYGLRLRNQLPSLIDRLVEDIYTRQACASIFSDLDCVDVSKTHLPCNVFLQFLCRPPLLDLHVTSRSSDFITGFSIDTLHWQALLVLMANELRARKLNVIPNRVNYNIASLHVYAGDKVLIDSWSTSWREEVSYEHFIPLTITLSEAIQRSRAMFEGNMTVIALAEVLQLNNIGIARVRDLDDMFRTYRNKLVR